MIGWNNVAGDDAASACPACSRTATFDTWSPGYLMFIAATHNGISRLYETFGNGGTPTPWSARSAPNETRAPGIKQNPPLPRVRWSLRNNNNYEQTGLLVSLNYFANNRKLFLQQLLREEQALDPEAEDRRSGGVRLPGRRSASRRAGRAAARCCRSSASRSRARPRRSP